VQGAGLPLLRTSFMERRGGGPRVVVFFFHVMGCTLMGCPSVNVLPAGEGEDSFPFLRPAAGGHCPFLTTKKKKDQPSFWRTRGQTAGNGGIYGV